jgi:predicted transposase YdaD
MVHFDPQTFVDFVLPGAQYVHQQPEKLKNWQLEVDALLDVVIGGEEILVHIEFQTYNDSNMAERLLQYNVLARSEYKKPVRSYVIWLLKDGPVCQSPLCWMAPGYQGQEEMVRFSYGSIEIGKLTPDFIFKIGQPGLLPFIPLTDGGATKEQVERMFAELASVNDRNLELVGFTLASLAFIRKNRKLDWKWLQKRFKNMHDILRESPIYQLILEEGRQEERKKGDTKEVKAMRQSVSDVVKARFPDLAKVTKQRVAKIKDPKLLRNLLVEMAKAESSEQARQLLLTQP